MAESPRLNSIFSFPICMWSKFLKSLLAHFHKNFLRKKILSFPLFPFDFLLCLKTSELQTMFCLSASILRALKLQMAKPS